jgi:hypothetical protein
VLQHDFIPAIADIAIACDNFAGMHSTVVVGAAHKNRRTIGLVAGGPLGWPLILRGVAGSSPGQTDRILRNQLAAQAESGQDPENHGGE